MKGGSSSILASQATAVAFWPWHLTQHWLSLWAGLVLGALAWVGVTPAAFVPQAKMRDIEGVLQHMHIREDQYRQALKEMQEALDATEGDKKKCLRNLKKSRLQMDLLEEELAQLKAAGPAGGGSGMSPVAAVGGGMNPPVQLTTTGLHFSFAMLVAAVWWFYQQDFPGIQRKLVLTVLFPFAWVYISAGLTHKRPPALLHLYCGCWFLAGFIAAHKFLC